MPEPVEINPEEYNSPEEALQAYEDEIKQCSGIDLGSHKQED